MIGRVTDATINPVRVGQYKHYNFVRGDSGPMLYNLFAIGATQNKLERLSLARVCIHAPYLRVRLAVGACMVYHYGQVQPYEAQKEAKRSSLLRENISDE